MKDMILLRWMVAALSFLALPYIVPGITVQGFVTALILALVWGLIGVTVKPVLLLLTLPINLLTFGIFTFVINGFLLFVLGRVIQGFHVETFLAALLGSVVLSLINLLSDRVLQKDA